MGLKHELSKVAKILKQISFDMSVQTRLKRKMGKFMETFVQILLDLAHPS